MPRNINTSNNEGAPTLSADGRSLVFVACSDQTGYYGSNREGRGSCDLFFAKKIGDKWLGPINLPGYVNSGNWESQPSLSADGKTLYFVRGRKGDRTNNSDIYVSELQKNGMWGPARALPDYINTPNTEESVHIHPDGRTLYFASKGHPGMGGSDLYVTRKDINGKWSIPENLGYPINTKYDENSLMVSAEGDIAYFASDREGGFGDLDIYSFVLPPESRAIRTVYFDGFVYDKQSNKPLAGKFELFDVSSGERIIESEADKKTGTFMVPLPLDRNYVISVSHEGYHPYSLNFDLSNNKATDSYHVDIPMSKPILTSKTQEDSIDEHIFENVFFDLNMFTLRTESRIELNLFAEYLKKNISIKIELGGHTDSRGNETANIELSQNRAATVYRFLIEKGVSSDRMTFKGYGSSKPIFSEQQINNLTTPLEKKEAHQKNRRTVWRETL
jgi:outer membrane protein OmpA-like peptidoglycan-associated protein